MLNISNIQHFSIGDGSGIRTTVFLKGCNLHCPWCHNPENLNAAPVSMQYKATGKIETFGRLISAEELLPNLLEDKDFYEESNGGVTFSGGEAMLQADKLVEPITLLKNHCISVLIDTAGCVPYSSFKKINPLVFGYLFDFKTADAHKYRDIGGNLELVRENILALKEDGVWVDIRIPLIPNFNTDLNSIYAICEYLNNMDINQVTLIPFHRLGSAKYDALGLEYSYKNQEPINKNDLNKIEKIYKRFFIVKTE